MTLVSPNHSRLIQLSSNGNANSSQPMTNPVSVLVEVTEVPEITYIGPALTGGADAVRDLAGSRDMTIPSGTCDEVLRVSIVPQESDGWLGEPGVTLTRAGRMLPVKFTMREVMNGQESDSPYPADGPDGQRVDSWARFVLSDDVAQARLTIDLQVTPHGIIRTRASVENTGEDPLGVERLIPTFPLPTHLTRVIDQAGRHLRERGTFTHELTVGVHRRTIRGARSHNASSILGAVTDGTRHRSGCAYYGHVEWSGNVEQWVERSAFGHILLAGGELLTPGEVSLNPGDVYSSPWLDLTFGEGLDEAASRFHSYVRDFASHPQRPRPVTLNAWEAVYFDHSFDNLAELVEAAARLGVERFVLDDGWFGSRRDDTSGLGDWQVSPDVWPDGLRPLGDLIHSHGMEFGLWFEPEMINPDSDLARHHPEWILSPAHRDTKECRHQLVLNLTAPGATDYLFEAIATVIEDAGVDYIKWDYNRDLLEAFDRTDGSYAIHRQTLAVYQLIDRIHARFPHLEIESCAGGGGRIDLAMMRRAQRIWASDCIDPLERQTIQEGTALLLPPELIGSHIASTTSHTTGRTQALQLRAINALLFHLGIEWDVREASESELATLGEWVEFHKKWREVVHSGRLVTADFSDDSQRLVGIISSDGKDALYCLFQQHTSVSRPLGTLLLPGLDPNATYRVDVCDVASNASSSEYPHNGDGGRAVIAAPSWWARGLRVPGQLCQSYGIAGPVLNPEQAVVIEAHRID